MNDPLQIIKKNQRAWAVRAGIAFDADGYATPVADNMFRRRLSSAARKDFERGDGSELGKDSERGKIQALHDFTVLDVAQLLKHMLALAGSQHPWTLCCLWFEAPSSVADRHRQELTEFRAQIGADAAHFSALTYQELFARLVPLVGLDDEEYIAYLRDRYILAPSLYGQ